MTQGIRGLTGRRSLRLIALALWVGACATDQRCRPDPATGMMQCLQAGSGIGPALITGAAAGVLWTAGGGCRHAGCHPPLMCNAASGLCEPARCGEGNPDCPPDTTCDYNTYVCK